MKIPNKVGRPSNETVTARLAEQSHGDAQVSNIDAFAGKIDYRDVVKKHRDIIYHDLYDALQKTVSEKFALLETELKQAIEMSRSGIDTTPLKSIAWLKSVEYIDELEGLMFETHPMWRLIDGEQTCLGAFRIFVGERETSEDYEETEDDDDWNHTQYADTNIAVEVGNDGLNMLMSNITFRNRVHWACRAYNVCETDDSAPFMRACQGSWEADIKNAFMKRDVLALANIIGAYLVSEIDNGAYTSAYQWKRGRMVRSYGKYEARHEMVKNLCNAIDTECVGMTQEQIEAHMLAKVNMAKVAKVVDETLPDILVFGA